MAAIPDKVLERLAALMARTESSFEDEARTSALLAIKLMRRYGITPDLLLRMSGAKKKPRRITQAHWASLGGRKGGAARAAKLSAALRSEIASAAAKARWSGKANKRMR